VKEKRIRILIGVAVIASKVPPIKLRATQQQGLLGAFLVIVPSSILSDLAKW
jgi:hypothetical protein